MLTIHGGGGSPTKSSNDGGNERTVNGSGATPMINYILSRGGGGMPFRIYDCK